ncbi:oligosaccharide flippase family protein [Lacrimispora sp.]|uniref:oligosaccharide flippase family protein n=1 Tax=Lacrimispora sp. TaxID=2719234 RepID=UPI002896F402|nr:oligosaccharide flippase family protein [Lacrimispora sp.]
MMSNVIKNTTSLFVMNIAKIIFPLITLPYLTRVLSVEIYGNVSYVKALMAYMQIFVDFGFILSATKDIVKAQNDKDEIGKILVHTMIAKIILGCIAFVIMIICCFIIPILKQNFIFTILMFIPVFLTIFLADFFFQGIEEMHILTFRFVLMRGISTLLTFFLVKNNSDLYYVAILDIASTGVAVVITWIEIKKYNIKLIFVSFGSVINQITESAVYFLSNMASTAFSALNTILIGIFVSASDVAYWSVAIQVVSAVQALYTPITNGIYPEMIKIKSMQLLYKICAIFTPAIIVGCIIIFNYSNIILLILGGEKYLEAIPVLKAFIPLLFCSFYAMLFGWPALGAIGKVKETTTTTVITAIVQMMGLFILIFTKHFTIVNVAFLRGITEFFMLSLRYRYCILFREEFGKL